MLPASPLRASKYQRAEEVMGNTLAFRRQINGKVRCRMRKGSLRNNNVLPMRKSRKPKAQPIGRTRTAMPPAAAN